MIFLDLFAIATVLFFCVMSDMNDTLTDVVVWSFHASYSLLMVWLYSRRIKNEKIRKMRTIIILFLWTVYMLSAIATLF